MSSATIADRNLIFAILAVQNDFVSRDGVIAAMNAWISAKHKPISQILVEQGSLDPDDAAAIDGMISRIIRKSGGDVRKTLENLSSLAELAEPLAALGDTDLSASLSVCADIPTFVANPQPAKSAGPRFSPSPDLPLAGPILSDPDGELPENLNITAAPEPRPGDVIGRFRIIRLIGKGGQGAVYEAHDLSELDRTVALKTTLEGQFEMADALRRRRSRLLHEGRLNARLEHQYIIPIHGLGTTEDGRPYYAMRYLNQINLDTAIRNFHAGRDLLFDSRKPAKVMPAEKANQAGPLVSPEDAAPTELPNAASGNARPAVPAGQNPPVSGSSEASSIETALIQLDRLEGQKNLDFRDLLERFTDVCQAMHFAHTRRVLHRDLKPGNIMIGNNRETLVIDWGMAKTRAELQAEATKARPDGCPATISLEIDPRHRMSMAGHFIGTPGYAPPEQLEGDLTKLNETTDVYALGMILFEILTGTNPFHTHELRNTPRDRWHIWLRDKALSGAPDPLTINPSVPKPLAAICRKALAPEQKDRYATADALSEDVSNWLADEPTTAYQEQRSEAVARWKRKNPGKVVAVWMGLIFVLILTAIVASGFFVIPDLPHASQKDAAFIYFWTSLFLVVSLLIIGPIVFTGFAFTVMHSFSKRWIAFDSERQTQGLLADVLSQYACQTYKTISAWNGLVSEYVAQERIRSCQDLRDKICSIYLRSELEVSKSGHLHRLTSISREIDLMMIEMGLMKMSQVSIKQTTLLMNHKYRNLDCCVFMCIGIRAFDNLMSSIVHELAGDQSASGRFKSVAYEDIDRMLSFRPKNSKEQASLALAANDLSYCICSPRFMNSTDYLYAAKLSAFSIRNMRTHSVGLLHGYLHGTSGVAFYRTGEYHRSIEFLEKSEAIKTDFGFPNSWPGFYAFIAMAQYKLGRKENAVSNFCVLTELISKSEFENDIESLRYYKEAKETIFQM